MFIRKFEVLHYFFGLLIFLAFLYRDAIAVIIDKFGIVMRQFFSHPLKTFFFIGVVDFRCHSQNEHGQLLWEWFDQLMDNWERNQGSLLLIHLDAKIV